MAKRTHCVTPLISFFIPGLGPIIKEQILKGILCFLFVLLSFSGIAQQGKIDSLEKVLKTAKEDTNKVRIIHLIANELEDIDPTRTIKIANEGLALASKLNFKRGISVCLNSLGDAYSNLGEYKTALGYYDKRYKIVLELNDSIGLAGTYDNMGAIYLRLGDKDKCLDLRRKAINIYQRFNKERSIANGLVWIGNVYLSSGEYNLALDNYLKAMKLFENNNDSTNSAYALLNIAIVYSHLQQYDLAIKYALDAKSKFQKANVTQLVGFSLYRLGIFYHEENKIDSSTKYALEAKSIFEKVKDKNSIALSNNLIGQNYQSIQNYNESLKYYYETFNTVKETGDKDLLANVIGNIGNIYMEQKKYNKAKDFLKESEKLAIEFRDTSLMKDLSGLFIEFYIKTKSDSALQYFQQYQQLSDTLFNQQRTHAIAEMQTKYEAEKKDKEIALGKIEINEREYQRNQWIVISVFTLILSLSVFYFYGKRKDDRFKQRLNDIKQEALVNSQMSDHFIGNTMHAINNFIEENEKEKASEYLIKFRRLIRKVLENSFQGLISLKNDLEVLEKYIELEKLSYNDELLKYEIIVDEEIELENTMIPPMIFQVLIENSIRHGFTKEKGGKVILRINKKGNYVECIVEDNGIGRIAAKEKLSEKKKETSYGTGLAERLIKLCSKTAKASYKIIDLFDESNNPRGTLVEFTIPFITTS